MKISFCLITLNEASNLRRCLESCHALADEIIIVDSGSTDNTEEIAKTFQVRWYHNDWPGYVVQKNKVLALAHNEWVFSIDADEALSPLLIEQIKHLQNNRPPDDIVGFDMPRCVTYEQRWIRHGDWYPDRLVRLFRKAHARFEGGRVHERLALAGTLRSFQGELQHYSFKDSNDHWLRCQHYAKLWAQTKHESGKRVGRTAPVFHTAFRWFRCYILKRGFLDGRQGWRIAKMCTREVYLKYKLLYKMNYPQ